MKRILLWGVLLMGILTLNGCTMKLLSSNNETVSPSVEQPKLVFLPDYMVYVVDNPNALTFFYQNNWYWFNGRGWFISQSYNGPWVMIYTPPPFHIPPGYIIRRHIKVGPPLELILEDERFKVKEEIKEDDDEGSKEKRKKKETKREKEKDDWNRGEDEDSD